MKHAFILMIFVTMFLLALSFAGFLISASSSVPYTKEKITQGNFTNLFNLYFTGNPALDNRPCYGNPNATITLVEYSRPNSGASREFYANDFQELESNYIRNGKLKLCHKNHISLGEYNEKADTFKYALALSCVNKMAGDRYMKFYLMLQNTSGPGEINNVASSLGISSQDFQTCMNSSDDEQVREDAAEVDRFGMTGVMPRYYLSMDGFDSTTINGVPPIDDLKRAIKRYEVVLGD
ncbi:MAG: hypothetical protein EPN86_02425 [Nanoarchaeota archaeon]|nr:MAG: hypothetical protein EPN86_02425 [Nanoarchaeota archaeon]